MAELSDTTFQCSILLVSDDQEILRAIRDAVDGSADLQVVLNTNAATRWLNNHEFPHFILLSLDSPKIDAHAICKSEKTDAAATHSIIIGLASRYDAVFELKILELGGSEVLYKPLNPQLVRRYLEPRSIKNELKNRFKKHQELMWLNRTDWQPHDKLRNETQRMRVALDAISDAVVVTDHLGLVTLMNPIAEHLTGWRQSEAIGHSISDVMPLVDRDTQQHSQNPALTALADARIIERTLAYSLQRADRQTIELECAAHLVKDPEGFVTGSTLVFHDVRGIREMSLRMTHLAHHDQLTNLPNRILLQDRIDQSINRATRAGTKVALLILDLDNFKHVNDTFGHTMGDNLLQQIARALEKTLRHGDTVCRQGGDEFIILLSDLHASEQVVRFLRRLFSLFSQTWIVENSAFDLTTSVGVSLYPDDSKDRDELYRHADAAMYSAKKRGRNAYQFFSADIELQLRLRRALEEHLRNAVENNVFEIYYQPKVDVIQQKITGAEALVRWRKSSGELVPPMTFIPLAEETGLIIPLGKLILQKACSQIKAWSDQGYHLQMAINISVVQFDDEHFISSVADIIGKSQADPTLIEFEITESLLMKDTDRARHVISELKKLGICIALDDFGTGYSGLSYLKTLPFDVLKIDQSFIRHMFDNDIDVALIKAIIQMASGLKLNLVAEGVETKAHVDVLVELGCRIMQGYFFSHPIPITGMDNLLVNGLGSFEGIFHADRFDGH